MEVVANNMVSETPVLEGAALEELKALLDLQMKMFIEGLDELFAARDAKLDALCARSGACASEGSGVVDAAVAQEVIPDLELAAAATSATYVEPCVANIGSPSNCSMEVPNHITDSVAPVPVCAITAEYRVVDVSMLVPACTIAEEIIPDTDLVVAVSSATTAVPSNINIGTSSSCSSSWSLATMLINLHKTNTQVLLTAGTDTSALTTEWAMAELLTHPEALQKARAELDAVVGTARLVEESDIANLPYLQSVVKETLRLRPVGPVSDGGGEVVADVRRGTMVLVNAWAIHREPKIWDAPEEFRPERFMDAGAAAPMLPFGLGRRRCPGEGLAMRLVTLTVAALVQCFEWEVDGDVDMEEGVGLTMPMGHGHAVGGCLPAPGVCRACVVCYNMIITI